MSENKQAQKDIIMDFMKKNRYITNRDAAKMEIYRLSARIFDLRQEGKKIGCDMVDGENSRYGRYYLIA